jgi:TRAP-type C4-dicarboxylate transport system permease small subunit
MSEQRGETPAADRHLFEDHLAVAAMALLMVITFVNVLVRYFTDQSFAWTEEISSVLMLLMTLLAAAAACARDQHIRIENLFAAGSQQRQRRLALLSAGATWALFVVLALLALRMAWDEYRFEETSPGIGLPKWLYSIWLPVLCALIARRAAGRWRSEWRRAQAAFDTNDTTVSVAEGTGPRR